MKIILIVVFALVSMFAISFCNAATVPRLEKVGEFVCNVILDEPVKEVDGIAVVPFDAEYKLLLKNNNNRRASAKITIDGSPISSFGDLVINANSAVTLERFITESLTEGKKFKFVPLDNPAVDDPSREENGLIRVEFKLEKKQEYIEWEYSPNLNLLLPLDGWGRLDDPDWNSEDLQMLNTLASTSINCSTTSAAPGATIGGSESVQKFHKIDIDFKDEVWVVEIRLKGNA